MVQSQPTVPYDPAEDAPTRPLPAPPDLLVAPPARRRRGRLTFLLLLVSAGLILLLAAAGGAAWYWQSDLIMPQVSVLGVPVGGQTIDEATTTLADHWAQRTIVMESTEGVWAVTPDDLGIYFDARATAQRAHATGRSPQSPADLLGPLRNGATVVPAWRIDLAATTARLQSAAEQFRVPAVDARLIMENGAARVQPALPGSTIDVEATVAWLSGSAAQAVLEGRAPLYVRPVAAGVTEAALAPLARQLNGWLGTSLPLALYDPVSDERLTVTLDPAVWNDWARFDGYDLASGLLRAGVDESAVAAYLQQAAPAGAGRYLRAEDAAPAVAAALQERLTTPSEQALSFRLYHLERQHVVQPGETLSSIAYDYGMPYPWIQQANPSLGELLSAGQTLRIPSPDAFLPLPVVEGKRIIVSIGEQRVRVLENGAVKWDWSASTGIADSPTSPGVYQVQTHEVNAYANNWDLWMPYFMGIYEPVPGTAFMNGFHGFPTRNGSTLLWTGNLGRPVTYGCILISTDNAAQLYEWAEAGVVVEIRR